MASEQTATWRIALAALAQPASVAAGVERMAEALRQAAADGAAIVCFPETYVPGLRGGDVALPPPDQRGDGRGAGGHASGLRAHSIAAIVGMEWPTPRGLYNRAFVISARRPPARPPDQEPDHARRRVRQLRARRQAPAVQRRRRHLRHRHLPRGLALPGDGALGRLHGAQVVFQPQQTGDDGDRGSPHALGRVLLREGDALPGAGEHHLLRQRQPRHAQPELRHQPDRPQGQPGGLRALSPRGDCWWRTWT